jgi:hypothetical protein
MLVWVKVQQYEAGSPPHIPPGAPPPHLSLSLTVTTINPVTTLQDVDTYGARLQKVLCTPTGKSRPVFGLGTAMTLEWFPAMLSGNQEAYTAVCWKMVRSSFELRQDFALEDVIGIHDVAGVEDRPYV